MIFVYIAAPSRVVGSAMLNQARSAVLSRSETEIGSGQATARHPAQKRAGDCRTAEPPRLDGVVRVSVQ